MKPFATYERKGEKKCGKRERKWHIRWVGDQLAVFPLRVLYVLYMCQDMAIEERGGIEKKQQQKKHPARTEMPTSNSDNLLLAADWTRFNVVVQCQMLIYSSLFGGEKICFTHWIGVDVGEAFSFGTKNDCDLLKLFTAPIHYCSLA